jgi:hypothetical protein
MPRKDRAKPNCKHCGAPKPKGRGRKLCDSCAQEWKKKARRNTCLRCGEPSRYQKILCDDCRELALWKKKTRKLATHRKPCAGCGGPKGPGARRRYCDRCLAKRAAPVLCDNCKQRPRRTKINRLCAVCEASKDDRRREYTRERQRRLRAEGKLRPRKRPKTEQQKADARERQRIAHRLRAEQRGEPLPPMTEAAYVHAYGKGFGKGAPLIGTGPLMGPLAERIKQGGVTALAEVADTRPHLLTQIAEGKVERINVTTADKLCVALLGVPLSVVYEEAA